MAEITLTPAPTIGDSKTAVAAAPTCFGSEKVTVGAETNPPPAFVKVTIPTTPSPNNVVAAAPEPEPSVVLKVTDGATVYPKPALVQH